MKHKLFIALILILTVSSASARKIYNFNDGWHFSNTANISSQQAKEVNLPHVWGTNNSNDLFDPVYKGVCYYIKEFKVPMDFKGKYIYLRFGGASSVATVFINGKYAAEHKGAFTAFNVNITPFLKYGEYNSVLVAVSNAPRTDVLPYNSDRNIFGGIHSNVELIELNTNHISLSDYGSHGVYLQTKSVDENSAEIEAVVKIEGTPSTVVGVDVSLLEQGGAAGSNSRNIRLDSRGEGKAVMSINIDNPKLWNGITDPYLYDVKVVTRVANIVTDSLRTTFGIRTIKIDNNNKFLLNGKPYSLKGVNVLQDNSEVGSAYAKSDFEQDMALISEIGATAVRTTGGAHSDYSFDLYDSNGIVAWVDLPLSSDILYGGKGFADQFQLKENGREQLLEMIYQFYNHPSICFWGIFNELTSTGDNPMEYIAELTRTAMTQSPDRITVGTSIEDGAINNITQAIAWPIYYGWDKGEASDFDLWAKQIRDKFKNLKSGIAEYGIPGDKTTPMPTLPTTITKQNPKAAGYSQYSQAMFHEEYYKVLQLYPIFWGTFINSMFDFSNGDRRDGIRNGYNNMGMVSYNRNTKKDAFYFYKANWNEFDPFIHIVGKNSTSRTSVKQTIKAYTNQPEAKLIINGKTIGSCTATNGTVEWKDVELQKGVNRIIVNSERYNDVVEIEVFDELLAQ
ncbi:MAG: glycoside hydrolase family 2 TIM barrel-domain containing protein [Rikenellaceae bacterium]